MDAQIKAMSDGISNNKLSEAVEIYRGVTSGAVRKMFFNGIKMEILLKIKDF